MPRTRNNNRTVRQKMAKERQKERESRNPRTQLRLLDERLGKDQGATKERARLQALLEKEKTGA